MSAICNKKSRIQSKEENKNFYMQSQHETSSRQNT